MKDIVSVRGSKLANNESTNNKNSKSKESNKNSMLFDKAKSNNESLTNDENNNNAETVGGATQTKSIINENKNNLLLEYDHEINYYKHYNKMYKGKYTELSIKNYEDTTNAKEKLVNNLLTY